MTFHIHELHQKTKREILEVWEVAKVHMDEQDQKIEQLEKEKIESIDAWNSQLEKASARVKELEQLQSKYVWITREEMKEYSDINQALSGKSLAQHNKEVAVKAIEGLMDYIEVHGFKSVQRAVVIKYLEQLKEGNNES